jgi:hypothetical protein
MKKLLSVLIFFPLITLASSSNYYSPDLVNRLNSHLTTNEALKQELFVLLNSTHKRVAGYSAAKKYLFGQLSLKQDARGYYVNDVYCQKDFTTGVGPGNIPDQNKINCEHTWPQSKFTNAFPNEMQKSDLHHLYPTDSRANSTRGNFDYADVTENVSLGADCPASKSGPSTVDGGKNYFEPPTAHKGNVARAIFYFSIRYNLPINKSEEDFLKRWNDVDPVDADEMARNDEIEKIQGDRNPFIDFPNIAHDIENF